jgi:hypothetical protein
MDDFNINTLKESRNEWCIRLVTLLTPLIMQGLDSLFKNAVSLCNQTKEPDNYLMTFQTMLLRIPKWNNHIVDQETARIVKESGCAYLEDLVTSVHIIYLKILSAIRVGQVQKKIEINIPKLSAFIHKAYIHAARSIYKNVYLYKHKEPIQQLKDNRSIELLVQECIVSAIRESIPVDTILRVYMDETLVETAPFQQAVMPVDPNSSTGANANEPNDSGSNAGSSVSEVEGSNSNLNVNANVSGGSTEPTTTFEPTPATTATTFEPTNTFEPTTTATTYDPNISSGNSGNSGISFNDTDSAITVTGEQLSIEAPKTIERLEDISLINHIKRKEEELASDSPAEELVLGGEVDVLADSLDVLY